MSLAKNRLFFTNVVLMEFGDHAMTRIQLDLDIHSVQSMK